MDTKRPVRTGTQSLDAMTDPTTPKPNDAGMREAARVRPIAADGRPLAMRVQRRRSHGRRSQWLTVAGYAGLGFGCLLAATATFLLVAAPVDLVRDRAIELVKARTGRDLVIAGPTSLTYFPRFGVAFSEVSLASPPDMGGPPVLAARKLQVEMPFWSLLSKRVVARRVLLDGAVVELRVDAAGRRSWDFAAWLDRPTRLAQAGGRATDAGADVVPRGSRSLLPAANVRIVGATVRYVDERSGASREVAGIDADLATDETGGALDARGSLAWMGEKVGFEAKLSPADRDLARLSLRVAGRPFQAAYDGNVGLGREPEADGEVSIKAASWAELVQWLGRQRAATPETGALAVSAHVAAANRRIALTDLAATLGENSLAGSLTVETGGARPHVSGKLQLSELDFGRLLVRSSKTEPTGGAATDAIGDLLQGKDAAPGKAQVRGFTKRSGGKGWSDEIIDLAPLGLADAEPCPVGRSANLQERGDRPQPPRSGRAGSRGEDHAGGRATLRRPRAWHPDARWPRADRGDNDQSDAGPRVGAAAADRRPRVRLARRARHDRPLRWRARASRNGRLSGPCAARWSCRSPTGPSSAWISAGCSAVSRRGASPI